MVETIGPMVRGSARDATRIEASHVAGGAAGGAAAGLVAGAAGAAIAHLVGAARFAHAPAVVVVVAAAALLHDVASSRRLGPRRQTPRSWRYLLPARITAFATGFDLGLGFSTRIYFASYVAALTAAAATADPVPAALIVGAFGIARATTVVVLERALGDDGSGRLTGMRPAIATVNAIGLAQLAAVAARVA